MNQLIVLEIAESLASIADKYALTWWPFVLHVLAAVRICAHPICGGHIVGDICCRCGRGQTHEKEPLTTCYRSDRGLLYRK